MIYVYDIDLSQIVYFWENGFTLVVVVFFIEVSDCVFFLL